MNPNTSDTAGITGATLLAELLKRYQDQGLDPALVMLDEGTTAACLNQKRKTLEHWRREGKELPFVKIGRQVKYRLSDVLACLERNTFTTSREAVARDRQIAARVRSDHHPKRVHRQIGGPAPQGQTGNRI